MRRFYLETKEDGLSEAARVTPIHENRDIVGHMASVREVKEGIEENIWVHRVFRGKNILTTFIDACFDVERKLRQNQRQIIDTDIYILRSLRDDEK